MTLLRNDATLENASAAARTHLKNKLEKESALGNFMRRLTIYHLVSRDIVRGANKYFSLTGARSQLNFYQS